MAQLIQAGLGAGWMSAIFTYIRTHVTLFFFYFTYVRTDRFVVILFFLLIMLYVPLV